MSADRTATYEADPAEVSRVLLLYSGGLDTSVMLKWIQDAYSAEVVCLTVDLGQPGEDYEVIEEKALRKSRDRRWRKKSLKMFKCSRGFRWTNS